MSIKSTAGIVLLFLIFTGEFCLAQSRDLSKDKTLYAVGYAHLDTQWRWDYKQTIDEYIKATLDDNFKLFEKYPEYEFNFTGSVRYKMMEEYYPEKFEKLKEYIDKGRWHVVGSSVDECDVLVPSPESIIRQILYGNEYFQNEFGKQSEDFLLPDCFGFPHSLPSVFAHAGLKGFSTQKLTWGSAIGIPFPVGVWEGPDGNSVIAALNPGAYVSSVDRRMDTDQEWVNRINNTGKLSGVYTDYRYYGVGDRGGAPREEDVKKAVSSLNNDDSEVDVVLGSSEQIYHDITPAQKERLPKYKGEMMLTGHSFGTLTSQSYVKRMNRKNEQLADAAERAACAAMLFGDKYPTDRIQAAWERVLASQMHDILPGTSIPKAYEYSWNDEIIAANFLADVLTDSVQSVASKLDTKTEGKPLVLYNPLEFAREDLVTAEIQYSHDAPEHIRVYSSIGTEAPSQIIERTGSSLKIAFCAKMKPASFEVYDVQSSSQPCSLNTGVSATGHKLENSFYTVTINEAGDIAQIYDKLADRNMLKSPARLEFLEGSTEQWPAWNMDWEDRAIPPLGYVDGPAEIEIAENGPASAAIRVKRKAGNSFFTQTIRLSAGSGGRRIEVHSDIDWQESAKVLKASFPLTVNNQIATYTESAGTIQRPTNNPRIFEMLSHQWFDLTDTSGDYGVSVLEDCKFGSDKPSEDTLRLTLLYTPGGDVHRYTDQFTQDWGRHNFVYALYGHEGSWQDGLTHQKARRLNQPIRAFNSGKHSGSLGREFSMLNISSEQAALRAMKKSEKGSWTILRFQELFGRDTGEVVFDTALDISQAREVDGQERPIGDAQIKDGNLCFELHRNGIRSFAVKFANTGEEKIQRISEPAKLAFNTKCASKDGENSSEGFGEDNKTIPEEMLPEKIVSGSVEFELAADASAMECTGQTVKLPEGDFSRVYLLAAANEDTEASLKIAGESRPFSVQKWTGFIGQWDNRIWHPEIPSMVSGIEKGYIKRDTLAWFCTHRHDFSGENEAYDFSYLFRYGFDLPSGCTEITLPDAREIKVFALSLSREPQTITPAACLYDNFDGREEIQLRNDNPRLTGNFKNPVEGKEAAGDVWFEKAGSYEQLTVQPSGSDFADSTTGSDVEFSFVNEFRFDVRPNDLTEGTMDMLNDSEVPEEIDQPSKNVFFDNGRGRFIADLKQKAKVEKVNTFSRHHSDRSPQRFSLWAGSEEASPKADLTKENPKGWKLIADVDTSELGEGDIHASSVDFPDGMECRYLMWLTDYRVQGTFFSEIDIIAED
ncbi:Mannosylglycerate hydrolase [Sedimentisphaera cyanobacteriorum]|uniref:Mannosylglycerate hydrolase n=1 Tax=Sedimentisphaera cyanobacteriorum TaxID=1940790 RepID=A0A1Q2HRN4_9BACT|nr:alpha-mannosidase [Sedimentisphaera cyanobacteriorum]AQQ09895.1 Mannosylglycerate hydrolase [Sedimentisphaera cyanobacteriorum]